ncbi:Cloroperoxidase [Pseudovirgaria hyperparasitica]|uniref:Cloroperoxidase n=1 Tax=Pseudovirgaria hyperparasitica TaxID=470096 RepID=A0A6A6WMZ7_9PEZI|nr:Cloroperoxidase [Pseudovirgaria hyperparasitica]KAF2763409.1 Cloroperoxidase [Pseudovirgaria hyperparasitica]
MLSKNILALAGLVPTVLSWPTVMEINDKLMRARTTGRLNTGVGHPFPSFDAADQYVDVSDGSGHEFLPPGPNDLRGQCPGLNAAANHGFLPRNGRTTPLQTSKGLEEAYNMSPELAIGLSAISILLSGDIPTLTWSIGGAFPASLPLLLGEPQGLLGTHNKYEGDASIVRGDAYLNNGNVGVFQKRSWDNLMKTIGEGNDLTLDLVNDHNQVMHEYSLNNNGYYFAGPFSGLVTPAAHNFVVNFMSNHSAEQPGGFLSKEVLRSFFAVEGDDTNYVHHRGQERIPENWYKRPGGLDRYNIVDVGLDLVAGAINYGDLLAIGGNTGKPNTFTGVNVGDLTGGVFNAATLLEGNNLMCFLVQAATAANVDELSKLENLLGDLLNPVLDMLSDMIVGLTCPQLKSLNTDLLKQFPGYTDP